MDLKQKKNYWNQVLRGVKTGTESEKHTYLIMLSKEFIVFSNFVRNTHEETVGRILYMIYLAMAQVEKHTRENERWPLVEEQIHKAMVKKMFTDETIKRYAALKMLLLYDAQRSTSTRKTDLEQTWICIFSFLWYMSSLENIPESKRMVTVFCTSIKHKVTIDELQVFCLVLMCGDLFCNIFPQKLKLLLESIISDVK